MIYKVVLNGQAFGQDVKNILYYRTGIGIDVGGLTVGGTVEVANAVRTIVWTLMKPIMSTYFTMEDITAYVYNDTTFDLVYQNPTTVQVGEAGTHAGSMNGPANCAIVKFSLEPTFILTNGIRPPKHGYVAIGPLADSMIADDGNISMSDGMDARWTALCFALANNVETLIPPAVFYPIRVHQSDVLGVYKITSYADIRDATVRARSSFRRSRQSEE
jgi:hypothetical protein